MQFQSTRSDQILCSGPQAILQGLARDGGLFMPVSLPRPFVLEELAPLDYLTLSQRILEVFFDEFPSEQLRACLQEAYSADHFDTPRIAPLSFVDEKTALLELWHGPTCAFKDLALTVLPRLMQVAYQREGFSGTIAVLTATSGDTGKAALSGFADVPHTAITVFYPSDGVSPIQKLQMETAQGNNVCVMGINGNFDDCQRLVKQAYGPALKGHLPAGITLSSANSINIGRLTPQIVYYFSAYLDLVHSGRISLGEKVVFIVPTGNFGDIFAGRLAQLLGLPVKKLLCASNDNHVLSDFLETGTYSVHRPFHTTISPSMDILISSNLERLLFLESRGNTEDVSKWMQQLENEGVYTVPEEVHAAIRKNFAGLWCSQEECRQEIKNTFERSGILLDPHTAVAMRAWRRYQQEEKEAAPGIVLSTASPFKFASSVLNALEKKSHEDLFEDLDTLAALAGYPAPAPLRRLQFLPVRFSASINKEEGLAFIQRHLEEIAHA